MKIYLAVCRDEHAADLDLDHLLFDIYNGAIESPIRVLETDLQSLVTVDISSKIASDLIRFARSRFDHFENNDPRLLFIEEHAGLQRSNAVRI